MLTIRLDNEEAYNILRDKRMGDDGFKLSLNNVNSRDNVHQLVYYVGSELKILGSMIDSVLFDCIRLLSPESYIPILGTDSHLSNVVLVDSEGSQVQVLSSSIFGRSKEYPLIVRGSVLNHSEVTGRGQILESLVIDSKIVRHDVTIRNSTIMNSNISSNLGRVELERSQVIDADIVVFLVHLDGKRIYRDKIYKECGLGEKFASTIDDNYEYVINEAQHSIPLIIKPTE